MSDDKEIIEMYENCKLWCAEEQNQCDAIRRKMYEYDDYMRCLGYCTDERMLCEVKKKELYDELTILQGILSKKHNNFQRDFYRKRMGITPEMIESSKHKQYPSNHVPAFECDRRKEKADKENITT